MTWAGTAEGGGDGGGGMTSCGGGGGNGGDVGGGGSGGEVGGGASSGCRSASIGEGSDFCLRGCPWSCVATFSAMLGANPPTKGSFPLVEVLGERGSFCLPEGSPLLRDMLSGLSLSATVREVWER